MELNEEQLREAETNLKRYLPRSLPSLPVRSIPIIYNGAGLTTGFLKIPGLDRKRPPKLLMISVVKALVYGLLMLRSRIPSVPLTVFVDRWPDFNAIICKPQCGEKGSFFKDILIFANDETILEETIKKSSVIDWNRQLSLALDRHHLKMFEAVAAEKNVHGHHHAVCHMMFLEDVSGLPDIDSPGISLSSLNESHISLVNQTWKFGQCDDALRMVHDVVTHFPSCCVLDAEGKPVAWILVYASCAMGMLYTLPEHRGKGYAKILICSMAKRLHAEGYPVYCFIEEENTLSYRLFKNLGFTEDPSFRGVWFRVN